MIIVYLVLAIICLMVITAFYGKINIRKHWIGFAALVLLVAMMAIFFRQTFFVTGSPYHEIHKQVASTDLSSESVNGVKIDQILSTSAQKKDFKSKQVSDKSLQKEIKVLIPKKKEKATYWVSIEDADKNRVIHIEYGSDKLTTSRGIKFGDSVDKVTSTYGSAYRNLTKSDRYEQELVYEDRDNNIELRFGFWDNKVEMIWLTALDKAPI
ncbi:hypothetical protein BMT55_10705 [Listeria newyorkensis]|uniref:DUF4811 domain-containing protein n=1 Tax=Listeria newyorkensis TaxID=1497681 RepID=A0ABX4XKN4_9LIST|nr:MULTISPECIES: hypothetical protein [Listeria]KGL38657.1 hypothetical protein EP56_15950 [Listeriaceae bacterium FSL A5-0209]KGL46597.1 hypothetical protein EP58_00800 [Listeria newyorkensis]PNP91060.1 hypothetical protein BMT55_10705 [Listeria newyorkensis]RQW67851.1 hypothetical protein DUK53_00275 [Listeria sp. SHR_NRA_18]WAO20855.1 hypothetical protein OTR81_11350 [Listeria newyorkensis]